MAESGEDGWNPAGIAKRFESERRNGFVTGMQFNPRSTSALAFCAPAAQDSGLLNAQ
jgi:hypothetical protein